MGDDIGPIMDEIQKRMDRAYKQDIERRSLSKSCPNCAALYEFGQLKCSYCRSKRLLAPKKEEPQSEHHFIPPVSCF